MPTSRPADLICRRAIPVYTLSAANTKTKIAAGQPVRMAVKRMAGECKARFTGTNKDVTSKNQAMMVMLRGRAGALVTAIGVVGVVATTGGGAKPGGGT